jgi:hypothetical protein
MEKEPGAVPDNQSLHAMIQSLDARFTGIEGNVGQLQSDLAENTRVTGEIRANTSDLVDFFNSAQGAFKVLESLGKAAKPLMYIAGFVSSAAAAWATYRSNK